MLVDEDHRAVFEASPDATLILHLLLAAVAVTACTGIWLKTREDPGPAARPDSR